MCGLEPTIRIPTTTHEGASFCPYNDFGTDEEVQQKACNTIITDNGSRNGTGRTQPSTNKTRESQQRYNARSTTQTHHHRTPVRYPLVVSVVVGTSQSGQHNGHAYLLLHPQVPQPTRPQLYHPFPFPILSCTFGYPALLRSSWNETNT
jgi:hypothetical protein